MFWAGREQVGIEERVAAGCRRFVPGNESADTQASRLRLILVLADMRVTGSERALNLSSRHLTQFADLVTVAARAFCLAACGTMNGRTEHTAPVVCGTSLQSLMRSACGLMPL